MFKREWNDGIPEIIENGRSGILLRPTKDISLHHFPLLPECVVDPTTNELVKPRELDPQELAETIRTLIEDEKRMRTFGMNLYEAVKGRFTLQAYGNQLEAIYEEVLRV